MSVNPEFSNREFGIHVLQGDRKGRTLHQKQCRVRPVRSPSFVNLNF
jgi:hypothetical protein